MDKRTIMELKRRDAVEMHCVFFFSAVLLVVFYCASPAENPLLQRSELTIQHYDWQSEAESVRPGSPSFHPQETSQIVPQDELDPSEQELQKEDDEQRQQEVEEHQQQLIMSEDYQEAEQQQLQGKQRQKQQQEEVEGQRQRRRVAICLVGGLRAFQLTGPSIRKHLLDVYSDADLFLHAPVDANVHKLTLLSGRPHLASVKLFTPMPMNETQLAKELLTSFGSPNGIQGLLQYFSLVEGCWGLIEDYEARHDFKYDWVIRSRVDGFWNAPMPPLESFNSSRYYVPYGSGFGGLNDRLGVGTRETSRVALQRLSLLPQIHQHGYKDLNSETSFKAQFTTNHVKVELNRFPFCVMSVRKYKWPIGALGIPVASISSKGPLNGAKCRPCKPQLVGEQAWKALNASSKSRGAIGPTDDVELCDAHLGWGQQWEEIYDTVAGPDLAAVRQSMATRTLAECLQEMELFQQQWELWNAPSTEDLCVGLKPEDDATSTT